MQAANLRPIATDAFVIFDELHHAGDDRAWGDGIRLAFDGAARRLALSGTPFRSDTDVDPVRRPTTTSARPASDYEYGYGEALTDGGVVRPVYFPRIDGHMEWVGPDGSQYSCSFDDALDAARSGQRLRTALSLTGEWLPAVLDQAHEQLHGHPGVAAPRRRAGHRHGPRARPGIVDLMRRRHGVTRHAGAERRPDRVGPHRALRRGLDAVDRGRAHGLRGRRHPPPAGRGVRHQHRHRAVLPPGRRAAWCAGRGACATRRRSSSSPTTRACARFAAQIAEQRRHSLRRREDDERLRAGPRLARRGHRPACQEEQLSLFSVISAVALGAPARARVARRRLRRRRPPSEADDADDLDDSR